MKKILNSFIILLAICSCSKEESATPDLKLKSCAIEYLYFRDEIKYSNSFSMEFPPNDAFKTVVSYRYGDNRIIQATGGFMNVPSAGNFSNLLFSTEVYDSIVYVDSSIFVFTKPENNYSFFYDNPKNPTVYSKDSKGKLVRIVRRSGAELNYTYLINHIIEKDSLGNVLRNFYFENNNLVKIICESGDTSHPYYSKKEFLFQEYDTKPNPLKNMFHLSGAFFRAFSENNYQKLTINEYRKLENGEIGITSTSWYTSPIEYNAKGYPKFGDY